jgi:hypothetical protein
MFSLATTLNSDVRVISDFYGAMRNGYNVLSNGCTEPG